MEGYVKVAVLDNQFEAQVLADILAERRIPHSMRSYYDAAYDGLFQMQKGWGGGFRPAAVRRGHRRLPGRAEGGRRISRPAGRISARRRGNYKEGLPGRSLSA
jgi:hypothetical protein